MGEQQVFFELSLFGSSIEITEGIVVQWVIILLIAILSVMLTRNLRKVPNKKQSAVEIVVESIINLVKENMGPECINFVPYIGTLIIFLLTMNLAPLVGVVAPTEDLSVTAGLAIISFIVVQAYAIKKIGVRHYLKGYATPYAALLPMNIMERIMLPVSLCFRLFGNIVAGAMIMKLAYQALGNLTWVAQIAIPVPLHAYFDLFDGAVQTIIFTMLTMINIKIIADH